MCCKIWDIGIHYKWRDPDGYGWNWTATNHNKTHRYTSSGYDYLDIWNAILTHWGRVTHICVGTNTNFGSDNGLAPTRRQAIIWTNAGILLIGPLGTNFNGILSEIHIFSFKKIHSKMSSGKLRPFCLGLNVLNMDGPLNLVSFWSVPNTPLSSGIPMV